MSKAYEFLKECGYFYVLTINGDFPAGRPFGAVMEYDGKLFISTSDGNKVHKQLRDNGNIQILAKKEQTREWLRITGKATECNDIKTKQKMLDLGYLTNCIHKNTFLQNIKILLDLKLSLDLMIYSIKQTGFHFNRFFIRRY